MGLVLCPQCGSDEIGATGDGGDGPIALLCDVCQHTWAREPRTVCARCGSDDVAVGTYEGWAYDDIEEARDDPQAAGWGSLDREVYRFGKCHNRWRRSGEVRPFRPPT